MHDWVWYERDGPVLIWLGGGGVIWGGLGVVWGVSMDRGYPFLLIGAFDTNTVYTNGIAK